ncbi:MAG: DUF2281 domain-containing protein [Anaerolineae bacterium]
MNTTHQSLVKQITDEVQSLPENLVREVLDFIGFLRTKYEQNGEDNRQEALLATFDSWEDDREPGEVVRDIYATRTISE